ncbi:sensor domain-containing diguanylate cyclase [Tsukamurella sp. 1534]|uniref:sensor domain-containing diguanylate cyclase n=1 Tax=Tsukamurella sp. 1534 TaxID=1151061 RepID=UPI00031E2498|nr:sensor domain-containing diguanylate cyclase [Tsukamurella sp. 1534]
MSELSSPSSPLRYVARGESVIVLLVDEFVMSIADHVYLPFPAAVIRAELVTAFQNVIAELGSDDFDPAVGRDVGRTLVDLQITVPEGAAAAGRSIAGLPDALMREPSAEVRRRVALILAELMAGYSDALTRRIIDGQAVAQRAAEIARRSAEEGERQAQARLRMMFEHARSPVFVADGAGRVLEASPVMAAMMTENPSLTGPDGANVLRLLAEDPHEVEGALAELAAADDESLTRYLEHRGTVLGGLPRVRRWALSRIRSHDDRPALIVGVGHDVTELRTAHARLDHLAHHDPLTGLPNRRSLAADLRSRRSQALGFCLIDLDGFKAINDRLGHAAGDRLLVATAQRMQSALSGKGVLYRVGGDEFAVLVPPPFQPGDAAQVVQRALQTPVEVAPGTSVRIGASAGTAVTSATRNSVEALISAADTALYRSKGARRS